MKRLSATILLAAGLLVTAPHAVAQETESIGTVESEGNAVERFFYSVWSGIRSLSPTTEVVDGDTRVIATAGLRGAAGDAGGIQPYWKGDLAEDEAFVERVESYHKAIDQAREGNPASLEAWLEEHGESDLAGNARLALAITYADIEQTGPAREALQTFITDYPAHPLIPKARELRQRL